MAPIVFRLKNSSMWSPLDNILKMPLNIIEFLNNEKQIGKTQWKTND